MLELVRLTGANRVHHLIRKDRTGHVEYWKAQCDESRMLRLGGGGKGASPFLSVLNNLDRGRSEGIICRDMIPAYPGEGMTPSC